MGHAVRTVLSHLSPVFWAASAGLVAVLVVDPDWGTGIARGVVGSLILTTGAAIAGSMCGAIEATHTASMDMLLRALLDERPTPEPGPQCQDRVAALADRSRTPARPDSERQSAAEDQAG